MHVELNGRRCQFRIVVAGCTAHSTIGQRHEHASLHYAAAIAMPLVRKEGVSMFCIAIAPERSNMVKKTIVVLFHPAEHRMFRH